MKTYTKYFIISCLCFAFYQISAQENSLSTKVQIQEDAAFVDWNVPLENADQFMETQKENWGLSHKDEFRQHTSHTDFLNIQRIKYHQYHDQLPVIGAEYSLHITDGVIKKSSGRIFPEINCETEPSIPHNSAEKLAVNYTLQRLANKSDQSMGVNDLRISDVRLCIVDRAIPEYTGHYTLAYEVIVVSNQGAPVKQKVYVDAIEGKLILQYSEICHHTKNVPASGYHYRDVLIAVDSVSEQHFQLRDTSRNIQIQRVLNQDPFMPETEIISNTDNNWVYEEGDLDGAASDAMYSTTAYYDFLHDHFNREGIDGQKGPMICNVNAPSPFGGSFYVNAFWDGTSTNYGAGDCDNYGPLTTLSIVAHEFTHGLTEYTSALIYNNESGALNESISDIFGETLEYLKDSADFSWAIGNKIIIPGTNAEPIRDMSNPNNLDHPKFYKGEFWSTDHAVHTNSGVMNYWYYLIANGAVDTNEVGDTFNIAGMGVEKAIQIVYLMQTAYLTSSSDYEMAYLSSIAAAEDLFGNPSEERQMVLDAWSAVGVSESQPFADNLALQLDVDEFSMPMICLGAEEMKINFTLKNSGGDTLHLNEFIPFDVMIGYEFSPIYKDTLYRVADFTLNPDESREFTLSIPNFGLIPLDRIGGYEELKISLLREDDQPADNTQDEYAALVSTTPDLNLLQAAASYSGNQCDEQSVTNVDVIIENNSCSTLPAGTTIDINFYAGSEVYSTEVDLFIELVSGDFYFHNVIIPGDVFEDHYGPVDLVLDSDEDLNPSNDTATLSSWRLQPLKNQVLDFTDGNEGAVLKLQNQELHSVDYEGDKWLAFTRSSYEFLSYVTCYEGIQEHFEVNGVNKGQIDFCVDTRGISMPALHFDAVFFDAFTQESEIPEHYATIFELSIDGEQQALIYEQEEGNIEKYNFELPSDFMGNVQMNIVTIDREGFVNHALGVGSWVLFDDIRIEGATPASHKIEDEHAISLFPNPASSHLYLDADDLENTANIKIFNMQGQEVHSENNFPAGKRLDVNTLPPGSYQLQLIDGQNRHFQQSFVILR